MNTIKRTANTNKRQSKQTISRSARRFGKPAIFVALFALAGAIALGYSLAATSTPSGFVHNGVGTCLDVKRAAFTNSNPVQLYACHGGGEQTWSIGDDHTIRVAGFCLDAKRAGTAPMTLVQIYSCHGGANQHWSVSGSQVINENAHLCLDDKRNNPGNSAPVQLYTCNGGIGQRWSVPVAAATSTAPKPSGPVSVPKPSVPVSTPKPSVPTPSSPVTSTTDTTTAAGKYGWGATGFADEFNGSSLASGWVVYNSAGNGGNGLRRPSQVSVSGGIMTQTGTANGTSAGMALGGHAQTYGRWESRVRVTQTGSGHAYHPVVALIPASTPYHCGATDLDFYEFDAGQNPYIFIHNMPKVQDYLQTSVNTAEWHNVAVEITTSHITWFIDGKAVMTDTNKAAIAGIPYNLNVQLDANYPSGFKTTQLQVDWMRYYPLRGDAAAIAAPAPLHGSYGGC